jgi:hypothetical protein
MSNIVHREMGEAIAVSGPYALMIETISDKLPTMLLMLERGEE